MQLGILIALTSAVLIQLPIALIYISIFKIEKDYSKEAPIETENNNGDIIKLWKVQR